MGTTKMRLEDVTIRCRMDDDERLAALGEYQIVDTPCEPDYETLIEAMHTYCRVPMAAIAFVDADRMWMKAQRGFDTPVVPRSLCFCSVCIHDSEPLIVEDALQDVRFRANALVTGDPGIRFYVGVPMFSRRGYGLGSVCVVDTLPRSLLKRQLELLERTRDWVQASLEIRRLRLEAEAARQHGDDLEASRSQRVLAKKKAEQAWELAERMVHFLRNIPY